MNKKIRKKQSVIYVNFSPYENAGRILDYIVGESYTTLVFTFNFYRLSTGQKPSNLTVFRNEVPVYETRLFQTPTTPNLAFILLPIRSVVIFAQIVFHSTRLVKKFGPYDIYFTVNAFTAWTGNILRRLGIVSKTVFWVWDYYPPKHPDRIVTFMRWLYWMFDKPASLQSDKVIFLNNRLLTLRKRIGIVPQKANYPVVGIGTDPEALTSFESTTKISTGFIGVLKKSQGLDLYFDAWPLLKRKYPEAVLHIIGGGPDERYFRKRAFETGANVVFHGYVLNEDNIDRILAGCTVGIAPYLKEDSNVSYYSDPSKIKRYLSAGLPVITTGVFTFSDTIRKENCGEIISQSPQEFMEAFDKIVKHRKRYAANVRLLARRLDFRQLYRIFLTPR
jgi:glycosyltransferase involved in cell wall biosynthesis